MITITNFIKNELQTYNLPTSKKYMMNLRKVLTRKLQKKGLWDNAEKRLINGVWTKFFKKSDLENIDLTPYLTKIISNDTNIPNNEVKLKNKKLLQQYESDYEKGQEEYYYYQEHPEDEKQKELNEQLFPELKPNSPQMQQALNSMMLEAIFNKFFKMTPTQKKQFFKDYNIEHNWDHSIIYDNAKDENDPNVTALTATKYRLKHPEKYYYNERE